mmetsp:Transcript_16393/g.35437  ORF Transcript_16393/g.35437 Transcript_16393/m.35437 type:complete len:297 (-) Transcript_16393:47-937(-)
MDSLKLRTIPLVVAFVVLVGYFGLFAYDAPSSIAIMTTKGYVRPDVLFGHVHMAKTGGTSLNAILANKYERICGHKGYSYDAYRENERFKKMKNEGKRVVNSEMEGTRSRVSYRIMEDIGFEDCDYISHEIDYNYWIRAYGDDKFHNIPMELHVPCRDPIDHLLSQCNYKHEKLDCGATSDENFINSINQCLLYVHGKGTRYHHDLVDHFDVKCFDFKRQFTDYIDYISNYLQPRRLESSPVIQKEENEPRNKTNECIWENPELLENARKYLLENVHYYAFCEQCMGSERDLLHTS